MNGLDRATGADCIVIGGGVMGCAIAYRLAQAGVDTLVLERSVPGAEASSAAAGILAAQEEAEAPGPLAELALASRARFPALAGELRELTGIDIGYRAVGVLKVCRTDAELAAAEARYAWQRGAGQRVERLTTAAQLRAVEPGLGAAFTGGLHFPDDHQLDARPYARALSQAAARAGARFSTGAFVRRVVHDGARVAGVEVEGATLAARHVVVAAGSWSSLVGGLDLPAAAVRPVRGQIALLETRPPAVRGTIVCAGGYLAGRADGRVLCGSTMEEAGFDKSVTAAGLAHVLSLALELVPGLGAAPVVETWANFRPTTADTRPLLGETGVAGLYLATGHFRNGILLSPITAELVRDWIVGKKTEATKALDVTSFAPRRAGAA